MQDYQTVELILNKEIRLDPLIAFTVWAEAALRKADVRWEKRKQKCPCSGSGTALNDTLSETEDGGWIVHRASEKKKKQ